MIRSMTAFAKSSYESKDLTLDVFVRTYNHRFLDINLKLPLELLHLEGELRSMITRYLSRGRVEMTLKASFLKEGIYQVYVNKPLVSKMIQETQNLKEEHGLKSETDLSSLLRLPGLVEIQTDVQAISPETLSEIKEIVDTCMRSLVTMRSQEGQSLAKDILVRIDSLSQMQKNVQEHSRDYSSSVHARLEKSLKEILGNNNIDPNRLMQEVAYYAERADVTEELVRLGSHIDQTKKLIEGNEPAGRKLDFLLQEILREINTIGSKCDLLPVAQTVIEMKTEVEKIREQSNNVE
jgi:uncharacterized protein (TIGR00255 family)